MKLLILQGIPGAGKTTWAREFIKNKGTEWVIVNRDSIRESLGDYWVPKRESLVTSIENYTIEISLNKGYNVIVDATNLNPSKLEDIGVYCNAEIEYKKFDVSLEEAIERDKNRERTVGAAVINKFYKRWRAL